MNKILTSKWFAAVIAGVAFVATMLVLWKPTPKKAAGQNAKSETDTGKKEESAPPKPSVLEETVAKPIVKSAPEGAAMLSQVGEPGSLKFTNPDINKLIEELLAEKRLLKDREFQLNELARRLAAEKAEIGSITQTFLNAKVEMERHLTNQLNLRSANEDTNLQHLARAYTNMPSSTAVLILDGMDVAQVARIMMQMGDANRASILENFATNKNLKTEGKATEISEKIRLFSAPPKPKK
mgnify:FL=1